MTAKTDPLPVDQLGVEHRHGCQMPGWISDGPAMRGWHVLRCADCGRVRLARAGGSR